MSEDYNISNIIGHCIVVLLIIFAPPVLIILAGLATHWAYGLFQIGWDLTDGKW